MELDVDKIESEMIKQDRNKSWIAKKAGVSPQLVLYWLQTRTIKAAEPIGKALGIEPKDLLK